MQSAESRLDSSPTRNSRTSVIIPASEPDSARDELLAQLLAQLTEQLRKGQKPDIEAVARQHPELTGELRELWAAVQVAEELGKSSADPRATVPLPPRL